MIPVALYEFFNCGDGPERAPASDPSPSPALANEPALASDVASAPACDGATAAASRKYIHSRRPSNLLPTNATTFHGYFGKNPAPNSTMGQTNENLVNDADADAETGMNAPAPAVRKG